MRGEWIDCSKCGGTGLFGHECGEDCCACILPFENVECIECDGDGGWFARYPEEYAELWTIPPNATV